MGWFNKNSQQVKAVKTPETVYAAARSNLLLVVAFTAINVILRLVSADMYFLFSASTPMVFFDMITVMEATELLPIAAAWAFIITGFYLLCWFLSKKRGGWIIVATVIFVLDTLVLLVMYDISALIFDLLMHIWVLYYLVTGSVSWVRMKKQQKAFDGMGEPPAFEAETTSFEE